MIEQLIERAQVLNCTDIHIMPGERLYFRILGKLYQQKEIVSEEAWEYWWKEHLDPEEVERLYQDGSIEMTGDYGCRIRLSLFIVNGRVEGCIRLLNDFSHLPPDPNEDLLKRILGFRNGMVLIAGATGSGKTTTLMRILAEMNRNSSIHIVTLEDPLELYFKEGKSCIRQRRVGYDTPSFSKGIYSSLRLDPDVIVIGELRTPETIGAALLAAETGHLVIATVHGARISEVIERIVSGFDLASQEKVRSQLAAVLRAIMVQALEVANDQRVLIREYAVWNAALATLVREGKSAQINSYLQTMGKDAQTWKRALDEMVHKHEYPSELVNRLREVYE